MALILWGVLIPACLVVAWLLARAPIRQFSEDLHLEHARELFRIRREGLEARFVSALENAGPHVHAAWEDAQWRDDVLWARDRESRTLLAMVGVRFNLVETADDDFGDARPWHSTALFEFRKGRWVAEGRRVDRVLPDEAVFRNERFEPVLAPLSPRRSY